MKYLVYYDTPANKSENRNYAPAAANKVDYVCTALNRIGHSVELISASMTHNRHGCKGKAVQISERISLKLFPSLGGGVLPKRVLRRLLFDTRLFLFLLFHLKKGEDLLVYHSLGYANLVWLLRKIKKFRLILEVEEIYADVNGRERDRKKEFKLFAAADAYFFPTELLNQKINTQKKPYLLVHGTYQAEQERRCNVFDDNLQREEKRKIHCVYAGTFDPRKGGAIAAAAAKFLPENYHVHILGFGSKKETEMMQEQVSSLAECCKCGITYDGLLSGEALIRFLQSCDIGLSTQNPDAAFNETSFPSKILSYMANGLRVVSIRIPAIEMSAVGKYMYYYDEQTPEAIAEAIMRIDLETGENGHGVLEKLDRQYVEALKKLLESRN